MIITLGQLGETFQMRLLILELILLIKVKKNILVWNDQFYSENAFGHKFHCLQLFIGFSKQFIDFPDIGQLQ